jgi:hypothetical protein
MSVAVRQEQRVQMQREARGMPCWSGVRVRVRGCGV